MYTLDQGKWKTVRVGPDLESMQAFVVGYIQSVPLGDGLELVCNEEGQFKGFSPLATLHGPNGVVFDLITWGTSSSAETAKRTLSPSTLWTSISSRSTSAPFDAQQKTAPMGYAAWQGGSLLYYGYRYRLSYAMRR